MARAAVLPVHRNFDRLKFLQPRLCVGQGGPAGGKRFRCQHGLKQIRGFGILFGECFQRANLARRALARPQTTQGFFSHRALLVATHLQQ